MLRYIKRKEFPPFLDQIIKISPDQLPITAFPRIMCQHCGLWGRGILCPPLLYQTYPQFRTVSSSKKYFTSFKKCYIYVFKNDGTKRWWYMREANNYVYIDLVKRKGRQLKGCEASSARKLTSIMRKMKRVNTKRGHKVDTFIQGHCDLCARKCPNRSNPPCKRGGLASMEATGINVYQLLTDLGIEYEYPVVSYLTQVTMMVVK